MSDPVSVFRSIELHTSEGKTSGGRVVLGFIGAGNFAQSMLLPPLMKLAPRLRGIATTKPVNAKAIGNKYRFEFCATDATEIINDKDINLVFVTSRHDSHALYVAEALRAGKSVFVEKPLALSDEELEGILAAYAEAETGRNIAATDGRLQPALFRAGPCYPTIVCWTNGAAGHALSCQCAGSCHRRIGCSIQTRADVSLAKAATS